MKMINITLDHHLKTSGKVTFHDYHGLNDSQRHLLYWIENEITASRIKFRRRYLDSHKTLIAVLTIEECRTSVVDNV